jgi:transcriptional antiterminator RfaH
MHWVCAKIEPQRERLALHFLALNGFESYCPRLREQVRIRGRKVVRTPPLFRGYAFVLIVSAWWTVRWSPGVSGLIMNGEQPAVVSDQIIDEIRSRERNGLVELLVKPRGLRPGTRVRVTSGPLSERIGMLALLKPHERVIVLLNLLGGDQRVDLAMNAIEAV